MQNNKNRQSILAYNRQQNNRIMDHRNIRRHPCASISQTTQSVLANSLVIGSGLGSSVYKLLGNNFQKLKNYVQKEDEMVSLNQDPEYGDLGNTVKPITFNQVTNYNVINNSHMSNQNASRLIQDSFQIENSMRRWRRVRHPNMKAFGINDRIKLNESTIQLKDESVIKMSPV